MTRTAAHVIPAEGPGPAAPPVSGLAELSCAALDAELVVLRLGHDYPPGPVRPALVIDEGRADAEPDARGIQAPQGRSWRLTSVSRILRSEAMIGKRRNAAGRVVLRFDPLIDMATWQELQARLEANKNRHGAVRPNPGMLTGVAYCLKCRGVMHYRCIRRPGRDDWTPYRCDGSSVYPSRCKNFVYAAELEAWVGARVAMLTDVERVRETLIHGADPEEELERLREEASMLDPLDPADDARRAELRAQADEVRERGRPPDELKRIFAGVSIADDFEGRDRQGRRAMLLEDGVRVYAAKVDGELWCELEAENEAYASLAGDPGWPQRAARTSMIFSAAADGSSVSCSTSPQDQR
jgi:Recombinase